MSDDKIHKTPSFIWKHGLSRQRAESQPLVSTKTPIARRIMEWEDSLRPRSVQESSSQPSPSLMSDKNTHNVLHVLNREEWIDENEPDTTACWGFVLLVFMMLVFAFELYAMVISKMLPETGSVILDWIRQDDYYHVLIPMLFPVLFYFVTFNWMGMKFFRHN